MQVALETARQHDVLALIDALDAYQRALYPPESHHGIGLEALLRPEVLFAVARDNGGRAVGCGAVVMDRSCGELKRMYVDPALRGRGVARRLLGFLEHEASARGCTTLRLETGVLQHEALALYDRVGFVRCGPFGHYIDDPLSVFMTKVLA